MFYFCDSENNSEKKTFHMLKTIKNFNSNYDNKITKMKLLTYSSEFTSYKRAVCISLPIGVFIALNWVTNSNKSFSTQYISNMKTWDCYNTSIVLYNF